MFRLSLLLVTLFSSSILLADSITMGLASYAGSGCPAGSVGLVLSPDASQLSVLFDVYTVEANATKRVDRKNCNMSVPLHIPSGYSISIVEMDYRGFSSVPDGASADLDVDTFFAGIRNNGPKHKKQFRAKTKGDFYIRNKIEKSTVVWTPCGKDVSLKILTSLIATTNTKGEQTMAAVDSLDITAGLTYQITWQTCTEPLPPPPPSPMPHPGNPNKPPPPPMPHPMPMPMQPPHHADPVRNAPRPLPFWVPPPPR